MGGYKYVNSPKEKTTALIVVSKKTEPNPPKNAVRNKKSKIERPRIVTQKVKVSLVD